MDIPEDEKISDRLRQVRGEMNQDAFAKLLGIGRTTLIRYEKGERVPDADLIAKLLVLFKIDALWLLTGIRSQTTLTPRESALLDNYRHSDEHGKGVIDSTTNAVAQPAKKAANSRSK